MTCWIAVAARCVLARATLARKKDPGSNARKYTENRRVGVFDKSMLIMGFESAGEVNFESKYSAFNCWDTVSSDKVGYLRRAFR